MFFVAFSAKHHKKAESNDYKNDFGKFISNDEDQEDNVRNVAVHIKLESRKGLQQRDHLEP